MATNPTKQEQKNKKDSELKAYLNLISDDQKMKFWIKTLLSVYNNLPEIIKSVDKIIEINASSVSFVSDIYNAEKSTYAQVEKVIDLTERKNNLLNIYLITKNLLSCVSDENRLFLKRKFVYNWTSEDLAEEYQICVRTVFRRTEKIIDQIYQATKRKNWSLKFINLQVKNECWLQEKYKKIVKDYLSMIGVNKTGLNHINSSSPESISFEPAL